MTEIARLVHRAIAQAPQRGFDQRLAARGRWCDGDMPGCQSHRPADSRTRAPDQPAAEAALGDRPRRPASRALRRRNAPRRSARERHAASSAAPSPRSAAGLTLATTSDARLDAPRAPAARRRSTASGAIAADRDDQQRPRPSRIVCARPEREPPVKARDDRLVVLAEPVIDRARQVARGAQRRPRLRRSAGAMTVDARLRRASRRCPRVAWCVGPAWPYSNPPPTPTMRTGSWCSDRAVADELVRPQGGERHDRVDERDESGLGEPRRHADHVLLGDADVEEAIREPLGERLDDHEAEVAGQEHDPRDRRSASSASVWTNAALMRATCMRSRRSA